jgi:hypothetical protein
MAAAITAAGRISVSQHRFRVLTPNRRRRAVDPKGKRTFEGATLPVLKFFRRGEIDRWLTRGTAKVAKLKPPIPYKPSAQAAHRRLK